MKCKLCENNALKLIGECKYCKSSYCSQHRMPEDHQCEFLDDFIRNKGMINKDLVITKKLKFNLKI